MKKAWVQIFIFMKVVIKIREFPRFTTDIMENVSEKIKLNEFTGTRATCACTRSHARNAP